LGLQSGVNPSSRGLQHHCCFVAEVVGHWMELALVRDKHFPPPAASTGAKANLNAVFDGSTEEIPVIVAVTRGSTGEGERFIARRWSQNRLKRHSAPVLVDAHYFVTGDERK